jgi:hypothetical protein
LSVSVFLLSKYKQTKRLGWDRYISEHTHAFYKLHIWTTTTKYNSVCLSVFLFVFVCFKMCMCVSVSVSVWMSVCVSWKKNKVKERLG